MTRRMPFGFVALAACLITALAVGGPASAAADAPFKIRPDLDLRVFACAADPTHIQLTSKSSVDDALRALSAHCDPKVFTGLRNAFLAGLKKTPVDWSAQTLVIVQDWYGTGMAKATLELETKDPNDVRATIRWKVPPPPVTPDTTVARFAFTVQRSRVSAVEVIGRSADIAVLTIVR